MRILHIITSTAKGGAENHLLSLAAGQTRLRGDKVRVASLSQGPDGLDESFAATGVEVTHVPLRSKYIPVACIATLVRLIRQFRPDVVHSHLLPANIVAGIAAACCNVPHVASKHNDEKQLESSILWRTVHSMTSRCCDDAVICLSAHVAAYMQRHGLRSDNMHVVYYSFDPTLYTRTGRDIRAEFGVPANSFLAGIVARITPQKGHVYLIEAFARFLADVPDASLLVVGQEDENTSAPREVHALVDSLKLTERVIFTGQRNDAYDIMAALDVFVLPSIWEGFGMVLLEATSLDIPVIASNVSAIPEVLGEEGGLLVQPADPHALYEALRTVQAELPLWKEKAARNRERITTTFSLEKMVDGTRTVYTSALPRPKGGGPDV